MSDKIITHNVNFSVFIDKILNGSKCQTIRRERKNKSFQKGDKIKLFNAENGKLLGESIITQVFDISITNLLFYEAFLKNPRSKKWDRINDYNLYDFAIADGFKSIDEFFKFFSDHYGLPFKGVIIKWKDFQDER